MKIVNMPEIHWKYRICITNTFDKSWAVYNIVIEQTRLAELYTSTNKIKQSKMPIVYINVQGLNSHKSKLNS